MPTGIAGAPDRVRSQQPSHDLRCRGARIVAARAHPILIVCVEKQATGGAARCTRHRSGAGHREGAARCDPHLVVLALRVFAPVQGPADDGGRVGEERGVARRIAAPVVLGARLILHVQGIRQHGGGIPTEHLDLDRGRPSLGPAGGGQRGAGPAPGLGHLYRAPAHEPAPEGVIVQDVARRVVGGDLHRDRVGHALTGDRGRESKPHQLARGHRRERYGQLPRSGADLEGSPG